MLLILLVIAISPLKQVSATTNIKQLLTDAQNAGTILKWAISKEGSADFQTRPYEQYNATKETIEVAEKFILRFFICNSLVF